jgi:hypothetical protein
MTLPTESSPSDTVGMMEEGGASLGGIAVLDHNLYRDLHWCAKCAGPQMFLEIFEFENGRLVCCQGCGDERVIPFTRESEAA